MVMGMYPMGMYNTTMMGGNVHENLKARYGIGHADFGTRPKAFEYPMDIVAREQEPPIKKSWLSRVFHKIYF